MTKLDLEASIFPYLHFHDRFGAMEHLQTLDQHLFELMIFPPHCWLLELTAADRKNYAYWLDRRGRTRHINSRDVTSL
mgnify:FL=1|jgi:L-ribulose-5-phosphate 3-epimerase